MGTTLWFFLERPDGALHRIPVTRYRAFFDGSAPLPASRAGVVCVVEVMVHTTGRRLDQVLRVCPVLHRVTENGFVDAGHQERCARLAVETLDLTSTENVVNLGPHLARSELTAAHSWKPTQEQLQQLGNTLNRAASRPPVVVVTADGLRCL